MIEGVGYLIECMYVLLAQFRLMIPRLISNH